MSIFAIIPVKPFASGKARLSPVLSPEARSALCQRLFRHVIDAACATAGLDGIVVVSADETVRVIAEAHGAQCIDEPRSGPGGLNAALTLARDEAMARLASAILVLPADLAFVTAADIGAMIAAGSGDPGGLVTIAPDDKREGTNALLLSSPDLIGFSFGTASFDAHCAAAVRAGLKPAIVERPGLGFDVDAPEDLSRIAGHYPLF